MALLGPAVLLPPFMQQLQGYPVLDAGWVMAARGIAAFAVMGLTGKIAAFVDPRWLMSIGLAAIGAALWMMGGFNLDTPWYTIVDDLIFVVFQNCYGSRVFHTGLPFSDSDYMTYRASGVLGQCIILAEQKRRRASGQQENGGRAFHLTLILLLRITNGLSTSM